MIEIKEDLFSDDLKGFRIMSNFDEILGLKNYLNLNPSTLKELLMMPHEELGASSQEHII